MELADLGPLAPLGEREIQVRRATVVGADDMDLADLKVAESLAGPVLLEWRPNVDEPFLTSLPPTEELTDLAEVLKEHVPKEAVVLAWWDTSRVLQLLSGVEVAFGEHLGVPLFVPRPWRGASSQVTAIETTFWKPAYDRSDEQRFDRFVAALLADEEQGMAELSELAGDRLAILVLHVRDAILLGELGPEKLGVAFRDFPATGDVHGMVGTAHRWLDENGYPAYTMIRPDDQRVRAVALIDEVSGNTLAARLLPFVGNNENAVEGTTLVFQTGGFWVYRLEPVGDEGEGAAVQER